MKIGTKLSLINAGVVIVIMAISFTFFTIRNVKQRNDEVLKNCRMIVTELTMTREYLAESLASFDDIPLDEKMANFIPARAGYGIGKKFTKETGYILKQTSLKLRNPDNAPDEFERRILKMFEDEKNLKDYGEISLIHGEKFFLYMFPLVVKESCLKCHGDKEKIPAVIKEKYKEDTATDYKLGDIRGAISLKIPYDIVSKAVWGEFWYLVIVGFVMTGACIGVVFFLSREFVSLPFRKLYKAVEGIAMGNLKQQIEVKSKDEVGNFAKMLNEMVNSLSQLINKNKEVIAQVSASSAEILSTNEEQTSGAAELAASVAEVTATMEELSASAKQVASNSEMLDSFAEDSSKAARQGKDAVAGSMNTMEGILDASKESVNRILSLNNKSKQIGEVLKIINEVSGEIHLLSLNAAIEASGAGEYGKRFGVVASEVRRLAERTRISSDEIRKIVEEVQSATNAAVLSTEQEVKRISQGMEIAKTAVQALEGILESVEQTFDASKQIAMATQQQKSASEQVAQTMKEISEVVKHTAAGMKQSNAAIAELSKLTRDLEEKIKGFKT